MPLILVTPLSAVTEALKSYQPSHMITLLSPDFMIETPGGFPAGRHLKVAMNDVPDPMLDKNAPCEEHLAAILEFARGWDGKRPMLVHCFAGVSRSMATAYTILCDRAWKGAEYRIAREMRTRAAHAQPNRLIVRLADRLLERDGAMVQAVEEMGPGANVMEGTPTEFPLAALGL